MGWSSFRATGLTGHDPARSTDGYTLITPTGGDCSYLIDVEGRIVHRWRYETVVPGYAKLLSNGNLLARGIDRSLKGKPKEGSRYHATPLQRMLRSIGGSTTHLVELDWHGNVVWEHEDEGMHHDFLRLPNGNTVFPVAVPLPDDLAAEVQGGLPNEGQFPALLADDIVEVDYAGTEVRRTSLWKVLDPVRDAICPLEGRWQWTHVNGIDVTPLGNIAASCRQNNRVLIVSPDTGELLWKWGAPEVWHQHHVSALENGNIMVFDNGMHRPGMPRSRVVEVDPGDQSIVWEYSGEPEEQFFSPMVSSAEPLASGNVLICEGTSGRIFEVTRDGETVWEWVSPFAFKIRGKKNHMLFRADRYAPDFAGLAGRELDWHAHRAVNGQYGLVG